MQEKIKYINVFQETPTENINFSFFFLKKKLFLDIFPQVHNNGILTPLIKEIQIEIRMSRIGKIKKKL